MISIGLSRQAEAFMCPSLHGRLGTSLPHAPMQAGARQGSSSTGQGPASSQERWQAHGAAGGESSKQAGAGRRFYSPAHLTAMIKGCKTADQLSGLCMPFLTALPKDQAAAAVAARGAAEAEASTSSSSSSERSQGPGKQRRPAALATLDPIALTTAVNR